MVLAVQRCCEIQTKRNWAMETCWTEIRAITGKKIDMDKQSFLLFLVFLTSVLGFLNYAAFWYLKVWICCDYCLKWRPLGLASAQLLTRVVSEIFSGALNTALWFPCLFYECCYFTVSWGNNEVYCLSALHCLAIALLDAAEFQIRWTSFSLQYLSNSIQKVNARKTQ